MNTNSPEKSFFNLPHVQKVLIWSYRIFFTLILLAIGLASTSTSWDLSVTGLNYLIFEILRVPFGFAAFVLPVVGLMAIQHRSQQTARQISVAESQNQFANYYKHQEEFLKYLKLHKWEEYGLKETDALKMHKLFFPKCVEGDYRYSKESIKIVERHLDAIDENIHHERKVEAINMGIELEIADLFKELQLTDSTGYMAINKKRERDDGKRMSIQEQLFVTEQILTELFSFTPIPNNSHEFCLQKHTQKYSACLKEISNTNPG